MDILRQNRPETKNPTYMRIHFFFTPMIESKEVIHYPYVTLAVNEAAP